MAGHSQMVTCDGRT